MNVSFNKTPKLIDFTGNKLRFDIVSDYVEYAGYYGKISCILDTALSGNFVFLDILTGQTFIVYSVSIPDETNEIHSGSTDTNNIAAELNNLFQFSINYFAESNGDGTVLYIYSKFKHYVFHSSVGWSMPACFTVTVNRTGYTPTYFPDYSLFARLMYKKLFVQGDDTTFFMDQDIADLKMTPSHDEQAFFEIGALIKPYIDVFLPDLETLNQSFDLLKYDFRAGDQHYYGSYYERFWVTPMAKFTGYALKGKIDLVANPDYDLLADITARKIFLNTFNEKEIFKYGMVWMNFINPSSTGETVILKAKIFYTDETDSTQTIYSILTTTPYKVHVFDASIIGMGLENFNPNKEIYKYEIWVEHADTSMLCNAVTFKVIPKPVFYKEFAFLNRFGVIEIFHAITKEDINMLLDKNIVKKNDNTVQDAFIDAHNAIKLTTGSLLRAEAMEIQYMLFSEGLWEILNGQYVRCIVEPGTMEVLEGSEDIVSIEFTYRKSEDL